MGSALPGHADDAQLGNVVQDGSTSLPLVVGHLLVGEASAQDAHLLLDFLMVYLALSELHLRVGEHDLNLLPASAHVFLREVAEVDIRLHRGIHRDGNAAVAEGQRDVKFPCQESTLEAHLVVVGHDLVQVILGGIELGALLYLHHHHRNRVQRLSLALSLLVAPAARQQQKQERYVANGLFHTDAKIIKNLHCRYYLARFFVFYKTFRCKKASE